MLRLATFCVSLGAMVAMLASCSPGANGENPQNKPPTMHVAGAQAGNQSPDKLELARRDAEAALAELKARYPHAQSIEKYSKSRSREGNGFQAMLNACDRIGAEVQELTSRNDAPEWATRAYFSVWEVPATAQSLTESERLFLAACAESDQKIRPLLRAVLSYDTLEPVAGDTTADPMAHLDQIRALFNWQQSIAQIYCLLGQDDEATASSRLCVQIASRFSDAGTLASLILPDLARRYAYDTVFNVARRIGPRFAPVLRDVIQEYKPWTRARECWLGECAFCATMLDKILRGGREGYEAAMGKGALDGYEPDDFLAEGAATLRLLMKLHDMTDEADRIADRRVSEKVMREATAHGEGLREQSRKNLRFLALRPAQFEMETDMRRVKLALLLKRLESKSEHDFKVAAVELAAQEPDFELGWVADTLIIKAVDGHPVHAALESSRVQVSFRLNEIPLSSPRD